MGFALTQSDGYHFKKTIMKKLTLNLDGVKMLTKEQMTKFTGGYFSPTCLDDCSTDFHCAGSESECTICYNTEETGMCISWATPVDQ
jgi:hypothetical protein